MRIRHTQTHTHFPFLSLSLFLSSFPVVAATHYRGKRTRCCNVVVIVSVVINAAAFIPETLVVDDVTKCVIVGIKYI